MKRPEKKEVKNDSAIFSECIMNTFNEGYNQALDDMDAWIKEEYPLTKIYYEHGIKQGIGLAKRMKE